MKRIFAFILLLILLIPDTYGFCGFFVAKADAKLFNKSSQVIIARKGDQTTVTMSNDYQGEVKDFAMVVPVPVVLKKADIKVVNKTIFDKLDAYSAPRLAEYYDQNPCYLYEKSVALRSMLKKVPGVRAERDKMVEEDTKYRVKVEAKYEVGSYDILILSAEESEGLKNWLTDHKYQIPAAANEVLEPYILSDMKFFVAKINLGRHAKSGQQDLSPIQIKYASSKFMLPIRLGMANANGHQDMIVYTLTSKGRVETTNYQTVKIPSNNHVPEFVQNEFGRFYKDVFERAYIKNDRKAVFLEYAWDVSPRQAVKCDPCVGPPPLTADLGSVGVDWLNEKPVFFTRLHVRYTRDKFPQDLMFHETPNQERYQGRYVITHPAKGDLTCAAAQDYLQKVVIHREEELHELAKLTGWDISQYQHYNDTYKSLIEEDTGEYFDPSEKPASTYDKAGFLPSNVLGYGALLLLLLVLGVRVTGRFRARP